MKVYEGIWRHMGERHRRTMGLRLGQKPQPYIGLPSFDKTLDNSASGRFLAMFVG